jgi:site-specific recombinase XerD
MTPSSTLAIAKIYDFTMMETPYPYQAAKLHEYSSLESVWHVVYKIWSEKQGKLIRRRISLSQPTAADRRKESKKIIKDINEALKAGAIIEPITEEVVPVQISTKEKFLEITENSLLLDAITYFLKIKKPVLATGTYSTYRTDLNRLINYINESELEKLKLKDFGVKHAYHFLDTIKGDDEESISNRSVNNNKDTCITFFKFFKDREILEKNPFDKIKDLPAQAKRHTAFTEKQMAAIIKECQKRGEWQLLLFCLTIYYMGIRPREEARLLTVKDIGLQAIRVLSETAKGKITEHVQIPSAFQDVLNQYKIREYDENLYVFSVDNKPGRIELSRKFFYKKHYAILEKLELTGLNLTTYSWKHSGAIALWRATQNLELVRKHLRHKSVATTEKYLRDLGEFVDYNQINRFPAIKAIDLANLPENKNT